MTVRTSTEEEEDRLHLKDLKDAKRDSLLEGGIIKRGDALD
jgi:hypothetical protein